MMLILLAAGACEGNWPGWHPRAGGGAFTTLCGAACNAMARVASLAGGIASGRRADAGQ